MYNALYYNVKIIFLNLPTNRSPYNVYKYWLQCLMNVLKYSILNKFIPNHATRFHYIFINSKFHEFFFNMTYNIKLILDQNDKIKVVVIITYGFYYYDCTPNVLFNIWKKSNSSVPWYVSWHFWMSFDTKNLIHITKGESTLHYP
jgi:hypothetical protein